MRRNDEIFVHDGWQIVKVLDLQGETKEKYFGGAKQDELVASNDNYVIADHLGTVRKVVDKDGNAVSELQYDAFGQLISATGEKPRFRYTGKMFDDVTELQWNVHRWYDARVGRWCSEDPVGFGAGDGNLNRYVGNAVVGKVDFLGQWGANVHNDKTWEWARKDVEYTYDAADMIAIWDEKVDGDAVSSIPLASGYLPIIGAQGYHFNRNRPNTDSRTLYKDEHYQNAIDYCVDGKPVDAAQHLGIALHPLQDYYAHGDYGIFDTLPNGGLWTTHNKYGPVLAGAAGEPWQYPDDISLDAVGGPRPAGAAIKTKIITILFFDQVVDYAVYKKGTQRFLQTKTASINLLTKFRTTIEAKTKTQKICTCIKYFFE